jgi:hypothetical protein
VETSWVSLSCLTNIYLPVPDLIFGLCVPSAKFPHLLGLSNTSARQKITLDEIDKEGRKEGKEQRKLVERSFGLELVSSFTLDGAKKKPKTQSCCHLLYCFLI